MSVASPGKLIVIEGTDGSGKKTQADLLVATLKETKIFSQYIDFPRYYHSFYGSLFARYLKGEFGGLEEVDPHLVALMPALDRMTARDEMNGWLSDGAIVVANRYAPSNMAHQTAKVSPEEREGFLAWLEEMEYAINAIPREDLVIFLYVPAEYSFELTKNKEQREYLSGKKIDIQEENFEYQKASESVYLSLAEKNDHWVTIRCIDAAGEMRSREDIHQEIRTLVAQHLEIDLV
ncbi:thymidylate kinase [candidate division WWE3 bacterium]|uniref:Thymidylate kinase n=1 Tax=candidate division WWE3 bacterium TaxID=2053526 RepID=A0A955LG45_UNCKA|nr:thymidylate kinase [candidate division WWE3 bacterium]